MFKRILFFVLITLFVGCSPADDYRIVSDAMEPTYKVGEIVTTYPLAYESHAPARWDVVVFDSPDTAGSMWVSRVVGLPGETIEIREGQIVINGKIELPPSGLSDLKYIPDSLNAKTHFPYAIPQDSYFLLGDNAEQAIDSRYYGPVVRDKIHGKVLGPSRNGEIPKKSDPGYQDRK